jgi:flagellar motor switch protein FliM
MVQVVAPSEICVAVTVELRMRDSNDMLNMCLPFLVVEPFLAKVGSTTTYAGGARRSSQAPEQMARQVQRARVTVTAYLGKTRTSLSGLTALRPGDLLVLDRGPADQVELWIQDRPVFLGRAGTRRGSRAVAVETAATNLPKG